MAERSGLWSALALAAALFEPEVRAWQGRAPLGRVFWVYGVITSSGLAAIYLLALAAGRRDAQQALILLFLAYTLWILVAVWRCADAAPPGLRALARSLTVAWAANTLLVAGFLQLDLIAGYLRT
ncbi:hypothetical protein [Desertibaculum subflavum]|uniref:hypothetical protein n=1 Tax=Desertibaculum subflavum TaxID=2268458 RepID=UPI0034D3467D